MNKYFKFVGLKLDKFLNWDFQIKHISNKIDSFIFALSQIKNILPLNIRLLVYNSLVRPHILNMEFLLGEGLKTPNYKLKIRSLPKKSLSERLMIVLSRHI